MFNGYEGNENYGQVFYKKCRHRWYGTVHNLEHNSHTDFYLFRELEEELDEEQQNHDLELETETS